jgi:hypothetical protein
MSKTWLTLFFAAFLLFGCRKDDKSISSSASNALKSGKTSMVESVTDTTGIDSTVLYPKNLTYSGIISYGENCTHSSKYETVNDGIITYYSSDSVNLNHIFFDDQGLNPFKLDSAGTWRASKRHRMYSFAIVGDSLHYRLSITHCCSDCQDPCNLWTEYYGFDGKINRAPVLSEPHH